MHSAVGTTFGDVPRLVDNQRNFFIKNVLVWTL
jgi:hypothetical protein